MLRILMLGNSFTFYNDMPKVLAALLHCEVVAHTRGGAYLAEQYNPETAIGASTLRSLKEEQWDYVILQEQSKAPVASQNAYHNSVDILCRLIRENGAKPIIYATWSYREGSEKLSATGMTYEEMDESMYSSFHNAAKQNNALIADVGKMFTAVRSIINLYQPDDYHPTEAGSVIAAHTIAAVIMADLAKGGKK